MDLTFTYDGTPLAFGSEFDEFAPVSNLLHFEDAGDDADFDTLRNRDARRFLALSMTLAGFAPHPLEWWHWSYGDQWWAAYYGKSTAVYGAAEQVQP